MTSISILWPTLDLNVQQWLLQNPGTTVLPRTYVNRVEAGMGDALRLNERGEHWLSSEEMLFLKTKRDEAPSSSSPLIDIIHPRSTQPGLEPQTTSLDQ